MTNQAIENMELIVVEFEKVIKNEEYNVLKTLSNTYGTMLNDYKHLSKSEFKKFKIEHKLLNHLTKLELCVYELETMVIPLNIIQRKFKIVDNLSITVSKLKRLNNDIKWMTNEYVVNKELKPLHDKINTLEKALSVMNAMQDSNSSSEHREKRDKLISKLTVLRGLVKEYKNI